MSLAEVVVATLIVGLMIVPALKGTGAALRASRSISRQSQAIALGEDLMGEILTAYYVEPDGTPIWGTEGAEASTTSGPRTLWDDVDDYDGWEASPPQAKDGEVLAELAGWKRSVEVVHVDPENLSTVLADGDDRGVRRITVSVAYDGEPLVSLVTLQTEAWLDMIPEPGNDQTTGSLPPVNQPPMAEATGMPTSGDRVVPVDFDATGSSDPEGKPLVYSWDFGDGETGSGATPSHTYTNYSFSTKVYNVTLTVTDEAGAVATDTVTITVYGF